MTVPRTGPCSFVAAATISAVLVGFLLLLSCRLQRASVNEQALSVSVYCNAAMALLAFSLVYTDSDSLTQELGYSKEDSGLIVSVAAVGCAVGGVIGWMILHLRPELYRSQTRTIMLTCSFVSMIATIPYVFISADPNKDSSWQWPVLLASRGLQGLADGVAYFLVELSVMRLTPCDQLPGQFVWLGRVLTLALGLGPLIAASSQELEGLYSAHSSPSFLTVGLMQFMLYFVGAIGMLTMLPSWDKTNIYDDEDSSETLVPEIVSSTYNPYRRRVVLIGGLICGLFRAYTVAGLEVVTAQLLEDEYGWDVRVIGLTIGGTFCMSFLTAELFRDGFSSDWIVYMLMLLCLFGSALVFTETCGLVSMSHSQCPILLVSSDVVVFSVLYNAEAVIRGITMSQIVPGSFFNAQNMTLCYAVLTDGLGRFLGPFVGRHLASQSQSAYAMQQMILIIGVFLSGILVLTHKQAEDAQATVEHGRGNHQILNEKSRLNTFTA